MKMTILCGISGSGKSTRARLLYEAIYSSPICSADDYFYENGEYNFDASKLSEAHESCLRRCIEFARFNEDNIVIDNTNTTVAEIAPYAAIALAYGYELDIVKVQCDVDKAFARNVHKVPKEVIEAQAKRLANLELPPWWPCREVG